MTAEEELLEFCKEPRSINDIKDFLGLKTINQASWRFTRPLVKQGKLRFTIPSNPCHLLQRYVNTAVEDTPELQEKIKLVSKSVSNLALEEKVLEFCKDPRTLQEIAKHLNINHSSLVKKRTVKPLLNEGKLKLRYPHDPLYQYQEYMVIDCDTMQLTQDNIINFCKTPRYKNEIRDCFKLNVRLARRFINPLVESGKLVYAECIKHGKTLVLSKLVANKNNKKEY